MLHLSYIDSERCASKGPGGGSPVVGFMLAGGLLLTSQGRPALRAMCSSLSHPEGGVASRAKGPGAGARLHSWAVPTAISPGGAGRRVKCRYGRQSISWPVGHSLSLKLAKAEPAAGEGAGRHLQGEAGSVVHTTSAETMVGETVGPAKQGSTSPDPCGANPNGPG